MGVRAIITHIVTLPVSPIQTALKCLHKLIGYKGDGIMVSKLWPTVCDSAATVVFSFRLSALLHNHNYALRQPCFCLLPNMWKVKPAPVLAGSCWETRWSSISWTFISFWGTEIEGTKHIQRNKSYTIKIIQIYQSLGWFVKLDLFYAYKEAF